MVVQCLPLKEDLEENRTVYRIVCELYRQGNEEVR